MTVAEFIETLRSYQGNATLVFVTPPGDSYVLDFLEFSARGVHTGGQPELTFNLTK